MTRCTDYESLLDPFVDGELSPEEAAQVQAHLAECPDCRAYVETALAIRSAFPTVEETVLPEHFAQDVMTAIHALPAKNSRWSPWKKLLLPLAACFALIVLCQGLPLLQQNVPTAQEPTNPSAPLTIDSNESDPVPLEDSALPDVPAKRSGSNAADLPSPPPEEAPSPQSKPQQAPLEPASPKKPPSQKPSPKKPVSTGLLTSPVLPRPLEESTQRPQEELDRATVPASNTSFFLQLTLTQEEAGTLLDPFTPVTETKEKRVYTLSREEFSTIQEQLGDLPTEPSEGTLAEITVLIP